MFGMKKMTKRQKKKFKWFIAFIIFVVWASYFSYYMWKNDLSISDAKKQLLWEEKGEQIKNPSPNPLPLSLKEGGQYWKVLQKEHIK